MYIYTYIYIHITCREISLVEVCMMVLGIISFLADASETLVFTRGLKVLRLFFLGRPFVHSQKCLFFQWFSKGFGKPCSGIISFLARARVSLETQRFPMVLHGFAVFLSCQFISFLAGPIRNHWFLQGFLRFSGNRAVPGIGKCAGT